MTLFQTVCLRTNGNLKKNCFFFFSNSSLLPVFTSLMELLDEF